MKHIFSLLLLAAVCMCLVIGSHVNERTAVDIWLHGESNHFRENLMYLIPVFIYSWMIWINGKEKFFVRLFRYIFLSILYVMILIASFLFISFLLESISTYSNSIVSIISSICFFLLFDLINLGWNYLLATCEKKSLTSKNLWILFLTQLFMPIFCLLWWLILRLTFNDQYPELNAFQNGSAIFAFILYEGIYYLWLKGKIKIPFRPVKGSFFQNFFSPKEFEV